MVVALRIQKLDKVYGQLWANRGVTLAIHVGDLACIIGPNGAGKTTLVRQVMGVVRPTAGAISLLGTDIVANRTFPSEVCAYLPQGALPFPDLTVEEAIRCAARLRGGRAERLNSAIDDAIELWGLESKRRQPINRLSGGERRLAGLAAALAGDREILILDEPTNELAPEARAKVWATLARFRAAGRTVIVITHNVHEIESIVTRLTVVNEGRVVAQGTLRQVRSRIDRLNVVRLSVPEGFRRAVKLHDPVTMGDRLICRVPRTEIASLIYSIESEWGTGASGDIEVTPPSLVDVYLSLIQTAKKPQSVRERSEENQTDSGDSR